MNEITFGAGSTGWNYTVTDGQDETYTGTIPEGLTVDVVLHKCLTAYTITATDGQETTWTNRIVTGEYFGNAEVEVTGFKATITVTTAEGAKVTAVCGNQVATDMAAEGTATVTVGTKGRYTVTAERNGQTATAYVDVSNDSGSYSVELVEFKADVNVHPLTRGYVLFEAEDWSGGEFSDAELRIPQASHGIEPAAEMCFCRLRMRVGRNVLDFTAENYSEVTDAILAAEKAALDANNSAGGTYPTEDDGHVVLTWEQIQYYILEKQLVPSGDASAKAAEKGFNWKDRETISTAKETTSLDDLLKVAYLPALGGPDTTYRSMVTLDVVQGLRFRRYDKPAGEEDPAPAPNKYDLDGTMVSDCWATLQTLTRFDLESKDLVLTAPEAYIGDVLVMG